MIEISKSRIYTETIQRVVEKTNITVFDGTERAGFTVVQIEGHQDDDSHFGEYHAKKTLEIHEAIDPAQARVADLNETNSMEEYGSSGGDGLIRSYRYYEVGSVTLHLCMVTSIVD